MEPSNDFVSVHLACQRYGGIKNKNLPEVPKSYQESKRYLELFKDELKFKESIEITDETDTSPLR